MHIKEISNKETWNSFLLKLAPNTFLQSWEWGQLQTRIGEGVRYLGIFSDQGTQVGAALVITVHAKRGRFLLVPHGPILDSTDTNTLRSALAALIPACRAYARIDKAVALRIAPLTETSPEVAQLFASLEFKPSPLHIHAELTWVLDITKSEEELLAGMRKTTRHAVKKAGTAGVSVQVVTDVKEGMQRFWPLYETTKDRHGFVPFPKSFVEAQAEEFSKENRMFFVIASHEGREVAGALLMHFGNTVFYYHGASVKLPSSVPAAQLLQWEAIKEAKRRGAERYNFWGIAPEGATHHPFAGITTFKKGFGGYAVDYFHSQDLPLSYGYFKLWAIDMWRKRQRGF